MDKENIKVLLIDDEKEFADSLAERMEMRELESKTAYDGEQGLQLVQDEVPHVVVLDLRMPGIDGVEVLERIKKNYPDIRVIVLTGHGTEEDERVTRNLGVYEYLQKPVGIDKLVSSIKNAFSSFQNAMSAATYSEAGDMKSARDEMKKKK